MQAQPHRLNRYFWVIFAVGVAIKILLAYFIPFTGDEAYFYLWGIHPDYGYYDHPPMVGWWFYFIIETFGKHALALRLPAILTMAMIALVPYFLFRKETLEKAQLLSIIFLFLPLFFVGVLITTDTPLLLFSVGSVLALYYAEITGKKTLYLLSGLMLGSAFLSKYFAVIIGAAFFIYFLFSKKSSLINLLYITIAATPLAAVNFLWNINHCNYNIAFNFVNRHGSGEFDWMSPFFYIIMLGYLLMPWMLYGLFQKRRTLAEGIRNKHLELWLYVSLFGLGFLLLVSFKASVGLHWIVSFLPGILLLGVFFDRKILGRNALLTSVFGLVHAIFFLVLAFLPVELFSNSKKYSDMVFYLRPEEVAEQFATYSQEYSFFTEGYSRAAMLSFYGDKYFGVWGDGSHHGRQDDIITDFRALDGGDLIFLKTKGSVNAHDFDSYCQKVSVSSFEVRAASFDVLTCEGFKYASYRDKILKNISQNFYNLPDWLQPRSCEYLDKYSF